MLHCISVFPGKQDIPASTLLSSPFLSSPSVIVLRNDRLVFQASIKASLLFSHVSWQRESALLAPPAAFYQGRSSSQQASSLSSINEEEEEARGGEAKQRLKELFRFPPQKNPDSLGQNKEPSSLLPFLKSPTRIPAHILGAAPPPPHRTPTLNRSSFA